MKKARALLLSLLLLSLSLLLTLGRHTGASSYTTRLVCATPHLTTTYVLLQNSDHFELQLVQHNGVRFMPIHNGMVTSYDLDHLKELSQLFKKIGERLSIRFGHDQCVFKESEWACHNHEPVSLGDLDVQNVFFKFTKRQVITRLISYESYSVSLSFLKDGVGYTLPMEYASEFCSLR